MDITNYDYNRIMFMTADCVKWVETTKNNFGAGWGTAGGITVTSTSEGLTEGVIVNVSYFTPTIYTLVQFCKTSQKLCTNVPLAMNYGA